MKTQTTQYLSIIFPDHDKTLKREISQYTISSLINEVCRANSVNIHHFALKTRKREIVQARQMLCVILKIYSAMPLSEIGWHCGGVDHATVMHSIKTVANMCQTDKKFRGKMDRSILFASNIIESRSGVFLSHEFWKYAAKKLSGKLKTTIIILDYTEVRKLKAVIADKEREIRMLRGEIARSRINNSYEFVD